MAKGRIRTMEKHLLLTLPCENGELYSTIDSRRIKLADCTPKIEVYEMPSPVQNLECSWGVKWYQVALVLCDDIVLKESAVPVSMIMTETEYSTYGKTKKPRQ